MTHVGVDLTVYTKIGLVIFVTVFALSLVWIFRKGSTKTYDATSNLPFEDEAGKK